jgi:hypothetical protein
VLKLDTAIIKAPQRYPDLIPLQVQIDTTAQKVTVVYGCASVTPAAVTTGTVDTTQPTPVLRRAPPVWSITFEPDDLSAPDPALTAVIEALLAVLEQFDPLVVDKQHDPGGIAAAPWQDGEELHDLACSFEAMGDRALTLREYKGPPTVTPHREEHGL